MKTNFKSIIITITIGLLALWSCNNNPNTSKPPIENVVVIGVDGMSPNGIQKANTPMLDEMIKNGAHTFNARAVLPSSSSSNWASMLMGADTKQHGITSNDWERTKYKLPPVAVTSEGFFPTIFNVIKDQKPQAHIGTIYDWDGFGRLFEKSSVDFDINGDHEDGTTNDAVNYIKNYKPTFTFIHLDHVDHAGHSKGHGSPAYYKSVEKADLLIQKIIQSTKDAGIFDKTLFIVTADHGGIGFGHGGETLAEMEIPFILFGAGVKKGYKIEETVYQYDNAATVAFAFGLQQPQAWIGRPVKGAFIGYEKPILKYKIGNTITSPIILPENDEHTPSGGIFTGKTMLTIQNPNKEGDIYYTTDGTIPSIEKGIKYTRPVEINKPTVVKSGVFINNKLQGSVSEGFFRIYDTTKNHGVRYKLYHIDNLERLPDFSKHKPIETGTTQEVLLKDIKGLQKRSEHFAIEYSGFLQIDAEGKYTFYTNSDDGSKLYIDNKLVVDNDGDHAVKEKKGSIELKKGLHNIKVEYFNGGGGLHIDTQYKGPNVVKQLIPVYKLFTKK